MSEEFNFNIKPRLLWCPKCRTDTTNAMPNPKCEKCGFTLITVVYSSLDGSRITGVEGVKFPEISK